MRFLNAIIGHKRAGNLFGVNLEIKKGEWVFLDGESGSGKTTILESMFGLLKPLSGSFIDDRGRDLYRLSASHLRAYRRTCGMIFQDHKLMPMKTVSENIGYALQICGYTHGSIVARTRELLNQVNMLAKADVYVDQLSGGEAQRVAIARALIHEPHVIFADEPTASLDKRNTKIVLDLLQKINKNGTTIVFATHDHELYTFVPEARVVDVEQWK